MRKIGGIFAGTFLAGVLTLTVASAAERPQAGQPNVVSCKPVRTAAQLQAMRTDLAANYCLVADIDLAAVRNFVPVGTAAKPFTGSFFGNGYVIRNLTINDSTGLDVGLFGVFSGAAIRDLALVNVDVAAMKANAKAGALAGTATTAFTNDFSISNVSVSGRVRCRPFGADCGGLLGELSNYTLAHASSSADVTGAFSAGGLAGFGNGAINDSFAAGNVLCFIECSAGGLVGLARGPISRSSATGNVTAGGAAAAGGLVGETQGLITQSFASGEVSAGDQSTAGGLVGLAVADVRESLSIGFVRGGNNSAVGGLIGGGGNLASAPNSYWDVNTSLKTTSFDGTGLTTAQLRAHLPNGFDPAAWSINKTLSYPFVNDGGADFTAQLATFVVDNSVYTLLPISQLDAAQYRVAPRHADEASLAAVFTMLARAFGPGNGLALQDVKIDRFFWNDAARKAALAGPFAAQLRLGALTPLAANARLTGANVIEALNTRRLAILRGSYTTDKGVTATHWMLATLYTKSGAGIGAVIANDPWTGRQVEIDPVTKKVVSPDDFPLKNFRVNAFQTAAIHFQAADRQETPRSR